MKLSFHFINNNNNNNNNKEWSAHCIISLGSLLSPPHHPHSPAWQGRRGANGWTYERTTECLRGSQSQWRMDCALRFQFAFRFAQLIHILITLNCCFSPAATELFANSAVYSPIHWQFNFTCCIRCHSRCWTDWLWKNNNKNSSHCGLRISLQINGHYVDCDYWIWVNLWEIFEFFHDLDATTRPTTDYSIVWQRQPTEAFMWIRSPSTDEFDLNEEADCRLPGVIHGLCAIAEDVLKCIWM